MLSFRKAAVFFAFSILLSKPVISGGEAEPLKQVYQPEEISRDIYVIHGPMGLPNPENQGFMNNPGFVITEQGVVVIDAGGSVQTGRMVVEAVTATTEAPIVATFSTHIHGDHWLGNQAILEKYPDADMYAHVQLIESANSGQAENWLQLMHTLTAGATAGSLGIVPDKAVNDGDVISIGGVDFSVYHKGQAHTSTDIAIKVSKGNILFTGDLVLNKRLGRMDDGNFLGLIETLDRLNLLDVKMVVPGHGASGSSDMIREMHAFYSLVYQSVEDGFDQGLTDFEIKPLVTEALSEYAHWDGFDSTIGRFVSLAYLEVEEANF